MSDRSEADDVVALWRLQSRYADVVTRRAWPELTDLFLPETTVHVDTVTAPARTFVGPGDFGAFVGGAIARFDHFAFVILNTVVEVDPSEGVGTRTARGRIFMCEVRHDQASDSWQNAHGVYQDRYLHQDGRWWFAERRYRSMARSGPGGEVLGLPPGLPPIG
ncbi:MAG TPA: nuclear transport factor 2 family protein [Acidimicrobiales bacterium]|nr:nuclear transport factor 2 family protein [Acidimicrobiales bacterium]